MRLTWHETGTRKFETGVDRGVLYVHAGLAGYGTGVAWSGLTAVNESPSGAEATPVYADNVKYLNLTSAEEYGGTIEAITFPDEFMECDGSAEIAPGVFIGQQKRKMFGFTWRTRIGNDVDGDAHGYKLHFAYGALAAPSEKAWSTVNETPETTPFSWEFTTTPLETGIAGMRPTAVMTVDSTTVEPAKMAALEALIWGDETNEPELPTPAEVVALLAAP